MPPDPASIAPAKKIELTRASIVCKILTHTFPLVHKTRKDRKHNNSFILAAKTADVKKIFAFHEQRRHPPLYKMCILANFGCGCILFLENNPRVWKQLNNYANMQPFGADMRKTWMEPNHQDTHTNWTFEFLRLDPRKVCPIHGKESTGLSNVKKNSQISTSCLAHGETNRTVRATNRTKVPTCSN